MMTTTQRNGAAGRLASVTTTTRKLPSRRRWFNLCEMYADAIQAVMSHAAAKLLAEME